MFAQLTDMINGIGVSPGISIGRALVFQKTGMVLTGIRLQTEEEISVEIDRFNKAINLAIQEIETIKNNTELALQEEDLGILEVQIELISDPQIREDVVEKIKIEQITADDALLQVIENVVQLFESMEDEYMSARAADVKDITSRIHQHLNPAFKASQTVFKPDSIVIAADLAPSDTITMDIRSVIGFATQTGSKTSHAAIIAKSKGIPAVVNCGEGLSKIKDNDVLILDGLTGIIYINPDEVLIQEYTEKRTAYQLKAAQLKLLKDLPATTKDGRQVSLSANISNADDLESVFDHGGQSVGLLRTEMLFMDRNSFPDEEEQFEFYKKVALQSRGKSIIVRTIDIGGDKHLPYFNLPHELNPFLGYRAIRICLDRKDLFITQLRGILRASVFGDLKIMFPMISNLKEIRDAKAVLEAVKKELSNESIAFNAGIQIGIMIEIPSAAVTADILAREVDFFSIGTNDLCQYTLAVDRMNEKITHLYDPFNPGVLRLISNVIEQGHKNNIHVGMCGEMASDPLATLLLIGMGLTDFSMGAISIPIIKNIVLTHSHTEAKSIYHRVMEMDSSEDIITYLQNLSS